MREGAITLPDGRRLAWAEWGDPDGTPVVFVPGAATSRLLSFGERDAEDLGVRVISVDRPGLGGSSPSANRSLTDFADDIRELFRQRSLTGVRMLANSQGAAFGLAAAVADLVDALALVSPADEVAHPDVHPLLPEDVRAFVDLVNERPAEATRMLTQFDANRMMEMVLAGSPQPDRVLYESPDFSSRYRRALEEGFAQGPDGYVRDTILVTSPWNLEFAAISTPVDVWFGAEDRSHSPDLGAHLVNRIPGARRHVVQGIGGALLWQRPREVLEILLTR